MSSAQLNPASLETIRQALERLRRAELDIATKAAELKQLELFAADQRTKVIPELFLSAEVDKIGMPETDDARACDAYIENFYHANIAKSWPPEKRQAAFDELKRLGAEDLIQTDIILSFPKASTKEVRKCAAVLRKAGYSPTIEEGVPWARLTSWLKEHIEHGRPFPKLDLIGAIVGKMVKLKYREEK